MTLEVFRKLPSINKEGKLTDKELFDQQKAVILETTVLTEEQFEELTAPDFNTLANDCTAYILTGSDELQGKKLANDCYEFDLLFPFENEVGEKIEHIKFTVPKVKHSQALTDISEKQLREDFMFQVVCDLDKEDLQKMSVNDYLTIKPKVGDFFSTVGGLLSSDDVENLIDVIPMYRNTSETELKEWRQDLAVHRYELILTKLGIKKR